MITTDAALYGAGGATALLDEEVSPVSGTCGCGQDLGGVRRQHCPRCGCCLG